MIRRHASIRRVLLAIAPVAFVVLAADAGAQGKGKSGGRESNPVAVPQQQAKAKGAKDVPPGQARKRYSHGEAVDISRQVLVAQGYTVSRVEQVNGTRVIHYYRGNNGRGRGRGPLMRMVVRPSADRYVVDGAPKTVLSEVMRRMGL